MTLRHTLFAGFASAVAVGAVNVIPWSLNAATITPPAQAAQRTINAVLPAVVKAQEIAVRYVTFGNTSRARYRVRERLVGKERDNDAVGETSAIQGSIALDATGKIVPAASSFTVDVTSLTSDERRRDRYVQSRLLITDKHPTTRFTVTSVRGLPSPLPTIGTVKFQLVGNLVVLGKSRPATWDVTATVQGDKLSGSAITAFTFDDYGIKQPKVSVLLSVNDTIRLEYDFDMKQQLTP